MIEPTGRLNSKKTVLTKKPSNTSTSTVAEVPFNSAHRADISAHYHGKVIDQLNPSKALDTARRFPQTGLGG